MGSSDITIRHACQDDAELLSELGARTFRDTFGADNTASDMDAYVSAAFTVEKQRLELGSPGAVFLLAGAAGETIGYAHLRHGAAPACVEGERPIEIARFYIDRPWQGSGAGGRLMQACLEQAVTLVCDALWLDVWEKNERATRFYTKWGFRVVGEQSFVLGTDRQHDLLMARRSGLHARQGHNLRQALPRRDGERL